MIAVVGVVAAPAIARLLTTGIGNPAVAAHQRALSTFLLRFFIPQVVLYALGAVVVAVLYAQRRLAVTAIAPIGLTVVIIATMVAFRLLAGPNPSLNLTLPEKLTLALGGTMGVVAFVGIPTIALWRSGFRLIPRLGKRDPEVGRVLRLSGWAVLQHTLIGLLLLASIVVGNSVEGGTLAFQTAMVFFLAPYSVLAQPVHTAILPDLTRARSEPEHFATSLRWALGSMAILVIPITAALLAMSYPLMKVAAFGHATRAGGVGLLAASLASLAIGLYPYSAFLLFARVLRAREQPDACARGSRICGRWCCRDRHRRAHVGTGTVALLGAGNTAAFLVGALVLGVGLARRTGQSLMPPALVRSVLVAAPIGLAAWLAFRAIDPAGRLGNLAMLVVVTGVGGFAYLLGVRALGGGPGPAPVPLRVA